MNGQCPDHQDVEGDHDRGPDRVRREEGDVDHGADHRHQHTNRTSPHLTGEHRDAGRDDDHTAKQVDPSPDRVVGGDDQPRLRDGEVLVVEDRDQPVDDVEGAEDHHHHAGERDPADPSGHPGGLHVLPGDAPLAPGSNAPDM